MIRPIATSVFVLITALTFTALAQFRLLQVPDVDTVYPFQPDWRGRRILHIGDSHVGNPGMYTTLRALFQSRGATYTSIPWVGSRAKSWLVSGKLKQTLDSELPEAVIVTLETNSMTLPNPKKYSSWIRGVVNRIGPRECYWISPPSLIEDKFGFFEVLSDSMGPCHLFDSRTLPLGVRQNNRFHLTVEEGEQWARRIWEWMNHLSRSNSSELSKEIQPTDGI